MALRSVLLDRKSLTFRLIVGASLLCGVALLVTYALLTTLFELHLKRGVDAELVDRVEELVAGLEIHADLTATSKRVPDAPKYDRQLSGQYWQIDLPGQDPIRSRSLWDARLPAAFNGDKLGQVVLREVQGPNGEHLRLVQRSLKFEQLPGPATFSVAADLAPVLAAARQFSSILAATLAVLGIGLVAGVVLQVRVGLRPLERIRVALAEIRSGQSRRLSGDAPAEIAPLAQELNALLDHHRTLIERARGEAGDLAHALKTPLAVLHNEIENEATPDRALAMAQIEEMSRAVHHHLARARAAGGARLLGVRADAAQTIDALARTLPRMNPERDIAIEVQIPARPLWFAGEAQDLSELLGNLLDNACKWSAGSIRIDAIRAEDRLKIAIADDGPGIAVEHHTIALQRGGRLDQKTPGSGLGLAIAADLAMLYGGTLTLGRSALGGLQVDLDLPAAT